jgi:parvulin-like peptidyl-prolyl isomerase
MAAKKVAKRKTKLPAKTQEAVMPKLIGIDSVKSKLKQPKILLGLIVVILIVTAFFLKGLFVAALVNGEPITRIAIISELEKQGGKQALSALVNQTLILQEARKKNIQVSQAEIDTATKQIEDSLKSQGQSLDTALAAQGMTKQDLIAQLKLRNLVEKLLADKIKVTDKEIADYIEKNKDTLPTNLTGDEIKKSVGEQLKQQKLASASQTWLEELNKNSKINYFVSY